MTETTQARTTKAARHATSAAEATSETLRAEAPSSFIDLFGKTLARTKDMHQKMSTILEHSTEASQEAFSCANRGSTEYRVKLMEIARQNANMTFDLARQAFEARSLPELLELTLAHQRKQFDLAAAQLKELSTLDAEGRERNDRADPPQVAEPFRLAS